MQKKVGIFFDLWSDPDPLFHETDPEPHKTKKNVTNVGNYERNKFYSLKQIIKHPALCIVNYLLFA